MVLLLALATGVGAVPIPCFRYAYIRGNFHVAGYYLKIMIEINITLIILTAFVLII